ncbi:hypothetical protein Fmac_019160 [Flemingia macrophylla]|uniref:Uncharacterized protein n=1 Tax=Flemingia macrophylla TaxID=520843 RepID=A0ABD1M716_9FABA
MPTASPEDLFLKRKMNNPFWARGIDVLGYSLNALRFSNLSFQDADSPPRAMEMKMGFRRMRWGSGRRGDVEASQGAPPPHGHGVRTVFFTLRHLIITWIDFMQIESDALTNLYKCVSREL